MDLQTLLGIEKPLIQAPMAGVQGVALAAAVSNAGGLGSLPAAMLSPEVLQQSLLQLQAATDKPFNVNFFCHHPAAMDESMDPQWLSCLSGYFAELSIDPEQITVGPPRNPFSHDMCTVLEEIKPPVVSFHFGLPEVALLERVKAFGAKVIASATTLEEALWLETWGVDAIIAQGWEAGGHRGHFLHDELESHMSTFSLVPQIAKQVRVPVIAAGGIASAQCVLAAMTLGASGVQVGTAFLLCDECNTSELHRAAIQSDAAQHTVVTNVFTGRPARGIENRLIRELGAINEDVPPFPQATTAITALRTKAEAENSTDFTPLWCGENASGCRAIPAADMVARLMGQ